MSSEQRRSPRYPFCFRPDYRATDAKTIDRSDERAESAWLSNVPLPVDTKRRPPGLYMDIGESVANRNDRKD